MFHHPLEQQICFYVELIEATSFCNMKICDMKRWYVIQATPDCNLQRNVFVEGSGPNNDPRLDQGPWRPHPNEREENRNELPPRFDMGDQHMRHPHDLSSRGFRRGAPRGHGHDSPPRHGPDMPGSNQGIPHPFMNKLSSRGFKSNTPGRNENRDPRWGGPSDEPPQGRGPEEQHGKQFSYFLVTQTELCILEKLPQITQEIFHCI